MVLEVTKYNHIENIYIVQKLLYRIYILYKLFIKRYINDLDKVKGSIIGYVQNTDGSHQLLGSYGFNLLPLILVGPNTK